MLLRRESLRPGGRGDWTGLASKTAWDWLQLLIVPAVLAGLVAWFNFIQTQISIQASQKQQETDFRIAADQQAEDVLVTFEGDISNLLLRDNLRSSKTGDAVRVVARARTLTALRRLDSNRKGDLIRFLYEAQLLTTGAADNPIIDLAGADLEGARLAGADLSSASLRYAVLTRADLSGALLAGADLTRADLGGANLFDADLTRAILIGALLFDADLTGADLDGARLDGANLTGAVVGSKQLAQAQSLQGATLPDGSKHP
jgi:uncharacterized protein YjbI with pentapeptide repeats